MNTEEFIQQLVNDAYTKPKRISWIYKMVFIVLGVLGLSFTLLWEAWGIHPEFMAFVHTPVFWLRLTLLTTVCTLSLRMMWKLSQPFTRLKALQFEAVGSLAALTAVIGTPLLPNMPSEAVVIAQAHGWALASVELGEDISFWHIFLHTSAVISLLALPVFLALIWIMKRMAPSYPTLAGASAGFAASALAALEFSFNSPYDLNIYSNLGYFVVMAVLPLVGALIGRFWLKW